MTVHVLSVGVSVLEHLQQPWSYFKGKSALGRAIEASKPWLLLERADVHRDAGDASAWLAGALALAGDQGHRPEAARQLADAAGAISPGLWPGRLSAELDTFDRVPGAQRPLPAADIAVLVCSDTPDGLLAGIWNATALVGGDLGKVGYLATTEDLPADLGGKAMFVRVDGLDAGRDDGFRRAMRELGLLGRKLLDGGEVGQEDRFRFYLSGGFKASIPYLIGLAEGLASLPEVGPVEAYVLHDTNRASPPIPLPLRRMAPERVQRELRGLTESPSHNKPDSDYLDGYAYTQDGGGWRLTPFGAGLKALFKIPPPGIGS